METSLAPPTLRARTRRLDGADPWRLLQEAAGGARAAWNERGEAWVALGAAAVVTADGRRRLQEAKQQALALFAALSHDAPSDAPPAARPRFVGGIAFRPDHPGGGIWTGFDSVRFWLPRRQVVWLDGTPWETTVEGGPAAPPLPEPHPEAIAVPPEGPQSDHPVVWQGRVERVLRSMERLGVEKAVLARVDRNERTGDPVDVLRRLAGREPGTSRFLFQPGQAPPSNATDAADAAPGAAPATRGIGGAFVGATPERLVRIQDGRLTTHAVAGSWPRSADPAADRAGAAQLQQDPKELREHDAVVRHLATRVQRAGGRDLRTGPRRALTLRSVHHLETPMEAGAPGVHVLDAVDVLYPTPAVAGVPEIEAHLLLRTVEPFQRGWYSGAVGWFDDRGQGSFSVALRCGLLHGQRSWGYAGAGIVRGSDPQREWQETEAKLAALRGALEA